MSVRERGKNREEELIVKKEFYLEIAMNKFAL